jgi:hypothetical protein
MKKVFFTIPVLSCMLFVFSVTAHAQKKITKTLHAKTVDISRGNENPNIRSEAPSTDVQEPEARGAGSCTIKFANHTGYYVNIYVDGYYRGQLSPWGGGTVAVAEGYMSIYCITAGKTLEWIDKGNCKGSYTFRLYP